MNSEMQMDAKQAEDKLVARAAARAAAPVQSGMTLIEIMISLVLLGSVISRVAVMLYRTGGF